MLLKPSLALPMHSGFVAFDGGGASAPKPCRAAEKHALRVSLPSPATLVPDAEPVVEEGAVALWHSPTWACAAGVRTRRVEGMLIIAICAYFVYGFLKIVHWL